MTATALKLYEIVDALEQVGDELMSNGGELTPALCAQLDELDHSFTKKVETVLLYMRSLEASAAGAEAEAHRLAELARGRRSIAARLKEYVKTCLESAEIPKVETDRIVARVQKNSRPSISCMVPLEQLPEGFIRVTRAFDKDIAYEIWKTKAPLPEGVVVEVGTHLRVQ